MRETLGTSASRMQAHTDFRLAQPRVLARREAHVAGQHELAAHPSDAASNLRDADDRRFGEADESVRQDWKARRSDGGGDVARLAGQIEVREVELGICALERHDTQARTSVHAREQILQTLEYYSVDDVERRIVEHDPPVSGRFLNDPQRCR